MLRNTGNIPYSIRADNSARDAESDTLAEQGSNPYSLRKLTTRRWRYLYTCMRACMGVVWLWDAAPPARAG